MFYQLGRHAFVRNIHGALFILDKYNDSKILGDQIAYVFTKHLAYQPTAFDLIIEAISEDFEGRADRDQIRHDAQAFYAQLESAGVVFSDIDEKECMQKAQSCHDGTYSTVYPAVSEGHRDDYYAFLRTPALIQVMVEITKICNERCLHCYIPHADKHSFISYDNMNDIIRQCKELGTVVEFKISGGECMTHPDFKRIIRRVKEEGFALTLLTNLTLLDDEIVDILRSGLLSTVQVSLFSINPRVHDGITSKQGSLEITLRNLEKLKAANIPVSIATQIMEPNKDSIEDLFRFCEKNGFRFLCDWTIIAREDGTTDNLNYRVKDVSCYENLCRNRLRRDSAYMQEMKALLNLPPKAPDTHLCNAGMNCLQIDTDLNIHPCPGWNLNIGNLTDTSIREAWEESPLLQRVRNTVLADFEKCVECNNRNICHICMAEAYNESNGKFEMPEYECKIQTVIRNTIMNE